MKYILINSDYYINKYRIEFKYQNINIKKELEDMRFNKKKDIYMVFNKDNVYQSILLRGCYTEYLVGDMCALSYDTFLNCNVPPSEILSEIRIDKIKNILQEE